MDGDTRLDIVWVGTATANVKWYENAVDVKPTKAP
jgi:hypothetical protein